MHSIIILHKSLRAGCNFFALETRPQEMMNSDMMEEVLGNPEKMEQARQAILENPTLKQAMAQLPGFSDMVSGACSTRHRAEYGISVFLMAGGQFESCPSVRPVLARICFRAVTAV